jgi:hypothetical protein
MKRNVVYYEYFYQRASVEEEEEEKLLYILIIYSVIRQGCYFYLIRKSFQDAAVKFFF